MEKPDLLKLIRYNRPIFLERFNLFCQGFRDQLHQLIAFVIQGVCHHICSGVGLS